MVKINGTEADVAGITVHDYLVSANYNLQRVAVEINGDVVPKSDYSARAFGDGDSVEIVGFVGGG